MSHTWVKDRSNYEVVCMPANESVKVAAELMLAKSIGSVIIVEEGRPVGIVTERDLLRAIYKDHSIDQNDRIDRVMSTPLCTINENDTVQSAMQKMIVHGYRRLVVVDDDGMLVAVCSMSDILRDITNTKWILTETQNKLEETGQVGIAATISNELDQFMQTLSSSDEAAFGNSAVTRYQFKEFLTKLKKATKSRTYLRPEKPILFMLLTKGGLNLYSKKLSMLPGNGQLISGFYHAINTFMQEIVVEEGYIDRICYLDYTITIKISGQYLFCYMFKGNSFLGIKKLDKFTQEIQRDPIIGKYLREPQSSITRTIEHHFDLYVQALFSGDIETSLVSNEQPQFQKHYQQLLENK